MSVLLRKGSRIPVAMFVRCIQIARVTKADPRRLDRKSKVYAGLQRVDSQVGRWTYLGDTKVVVHTWYEE